MKKRELNRTANSEYCLVKIEKKEINAILKKYPDQRIQSAVLPLLHFVQKKAGGWLPVPELERVAEILKMSYMRVYEIASFYTMFNLKPVGKNLLQLCQTTPCWLRGSNEIKKCIQDKLKISNGETTKDGLFTLLEVECLGACVNAPILQVNNDYFEDLNYKTTESIISKLKNGEHIKVGSVVGRKSSEPINTLGKK